MRALAGKFSVCPFFAIFSGFDLWGLGIQIEGRGLAVRMWFYHSFVTRGKILAFLHSGLMKCSVISGFYPLWPGPSQSRLKSEG